MNLLLTNDDGIDAGGLLALAMELQRWGELTVVAPRVQQSGVGHAITYRTPITAERVEVPGAAEAYAVDGTPADCVKFGLLQALQERPDLIVSGINEGLNLGQNVFYSGTVAAAVEGAMLGVRSVALSSHPENFDRLGLLAGECVRVLKAICDLDTGRPAAYNVNLPALNCDPPQMRFARHSEAPFSERYRPEKGGGGGPQRFKLDLQFTDETHGGEDCDVAVVEAGMISVTPLKASLTDTDGLRRWCGMGPVEAEASCSGSSDTVGGR